MLESTGFRFRFHFKSELHFKLKWALAEPCNFLQSKQLLWRNIKKPLKFKKANYQYQQEHKTVSKFEDNKTLQTWHMQKSQAINIWLHILNYQANSSNTAVPQIKFQESWSLNEWWEGWEEKVLVLSCLSSVLTTEHIQTASNKLKIEAENQLLSCKLLVQYTRF